MQVYCKYFNVFNSKHMYGSAQVEVADVADESDTSDVDGLYAAVNIAVFLEKRIHFTAAFLIVIAINAYLMCVQFVRFPDYFGLFNKS